MTAAQYLWLAHHNDSSRWFAVRSFPSYPSTLANSTLIIIIFKNDEIFENYFSQIKKNIVKDNSEYFGIFHLLKWKFQNSIVIWHACVEMAKVLR